MAGRSSVLSAKASRRQSLRRRLLLKRALTALEVTALSVLPLAPSAQASLPAASAKAAGEGAAGEDGAIPGEQLAQFSSFGRSGNRSGANPGDSHPPAVFRADEVDYDQDLSLVVSRGHVEIDQAGRILLADTVTYNQRTDTVTASGNVSVLETNGDILFADYIELTQQMRDAFVSNARILMSDKSRIAGNTARRTDGKHTEIRKGVYSPCQLCAQDPTRPPTWQIAADTIIHDQETKTIEYRNALVEFSGVPLIYSPYFSHPDPSVKRASGFLVPAFGNSTTLGTWASLPYYAVLDNSKDLTIAPIFTSEQGVNFTGEYRQRFDEGKFESRFSITDSDRVNETGTGNLASTSPNVLRGHVFANGIWDIDDDDRAGFDLRRATDATYLRRYHFASGEDFLTSHAYLENFDQRNYGSFDAYSFQSQRVGVEDKGLPYVLPSGRYSYVSEPNSFGAKLSLNEDLMNVVREVGTDTGRLSTSAAWSLPFTSAGGDVMSLTPRVLLQAYDVRNYPKLAKTPATSSALNPTLDPILTSTTTTTTPATTINATLGRVFPQVEMSWRHPFIRRGEDESDVLEPIAAFFSAPRGGNNVKIPNEDSLGFEFNDASLFTPNRYPGLDRVDGGTRVDYGLHAALYSDTVYRTDMLIGQSYRLTGGENFAMGSGLEHHLSDPVGRINISPIDEFSVNYRFRFSATDLASRRQEVGTIFGPSRIRIGLNYINLRSDVGSSQLDREQVSGNVRLALTPNWALSGGTTESLKGGGGLLSLSGSLVYVDDCLTFATTVVYSGTTDADVTKGTSFSISLVLKNLGQIALPSLKA